MKLVKHLFLPDSHVPYHDQQAFELVHRVCDAVGFDELTILGDFVDFYTVSQHSKDPKRSHQLVEEIDTAKRELARLKAQGFKRKRYIKGNHENRLERYIWDKAPELDGLVSVEGALGLDGWDVIPYREDVKIGRIYATHDVGKAGKYAVEDALAAYQDNVVIGHLHRLKLLIEGNARGVPHVAACFGWLGDASKADYMYRVKAKRDWMLGFGMGYMRPDGVMYLVPVPIIDYTCLVEGRLYKA